MKKSPLVHIVLFGLLLGLILIVSFGRPTPVDDLTRIVVTDNDIAQLQASFAKTWQRNMTPEELEVQLEKFVHDEVLYREAMRLGYAEGDPLIKHSLKIKMEFLGASQAENIEPSDEEIEAYFNMRSEKYMEPAKMSFVHVYFNTDKRGNTASNAAKKALDELKTKNPDLDKLSNFGDRFMLRDNYVAKTKKEISTIFGANFAAKITELPVGIWEGPVQSAYGVHLIYIYDKKESYIPDIEDVKNDIIGDLNYENKEAAKELFYTEILRNYQVEYDANIK